MSQVNGDLVERALARLRCLTELESPSGNIEHLDALRDALATRWHELGLNIVITPGVAGDHLVAEWTVPNSVGHVLLVTHYDTVWPIGELERQPFAVDGDRVCGPGVFDMKSGIVAIEFAIEQLRNSGRAPSCTVRIVCIADEEVSSIDGRRVIEEGAEGAIAVLGFEPAHPDGSFKNGRRGVARLSLRVTGRASHSGLAVDEGVSAIDELIDLLIDVRHGAPHARDVAINIGRISGGTRANVVAGAAEAEVGLRFSESSTEQSLLDLFHGLHVHRDGARIVQRGKLAAGRLDRHPVTSTCLARRSRLLAYRTGRCYCSSPGRGSFRETSWWGWRHQFHGVKGNTHLGWAGATR